MKGIINSFRPQTFLGVAKVVEVDNPEAVPLVLVLAFSELHCLAKVRRRHLHAK